MAIHATAPHVRLPGVTDRLEQTFATIEAELALA
jgi:hypothetical protein